MTNRARPVAVIGPDSPIGLSVVRELQRRAHAVARG